MIVRELTNDAWDRSSANPFARTWHSDRMAKAKAKAPKSKAAGKAPARRKKTPKTKRSAKSAPKSTSSPKSRPKAKRASNLLGGVAKGIAWLGDKVRGVVTRKKPAKKQATAKRAKSAKPAKTAKPATVASVEPATSSENLITLYNPLP